MQQVDQDERRGRHERVERRGGARPAQHVPAERARAEQPQRAQQHRRPRARLHRVGLRQQQHRDTQRRPARQSPAARRRRASRSTRWHSRPAPARSRAPPTSPASASRVAPPPGPASRNRARSPAPAPDRRRPRSIAGSARSPGSRHSAPRSWRCPASVNSASPTSSTGRRPNRSDIGPYSNCPIARPIRYSVMVSWIAAGRAPERPRGVRQRRDDQVHAQRAAGVIATISTKGARSPLP